MAASISKTLTRNLLRRSGETTQALQLRLSSAAASAPAISVTETQPPGHRLLLSSSSKYCNFLITFILFPEFRLSESLPVCLYSSEKGGPSKWSNLLLFVPGVITFGLGSWQIIRRQDKVNTSFREILSFLFSKGSAMKNAVDAILFSMDTFCCLVCSITVSKVWSVVSSL